MTFGEKLEFLTEGRSRADLSKKAGLPPNALSDYINKGYLPRLDTAKAIADILGVTLNWLADDKQECPPPAADAAASKLTDQAVMYEVCLRHRRECLRARDVLERAEKIDWKSLAELLCNSSVEDVRAGEFRAELDTAFNLVFATSAIERYEPDKAADVFWRDLPGSDVPRDQIDGEALKARIRRLNESTPASAIQQFIIATAGKPDAKFLEDQRGKLRQAIQIRPAKDRPAKK
jgi:transcriptional regulator with XRE-family HTH domain